MFIVYETFYNLFINFCRVSLWLSGTTFSTRGSRFWFKLVGIWKSFGPIRDTEILQTPVLTEIWNIGGGVQLWVQYLTCLGPNMTAILVLVGSKYVCNPDYKRVQIWLQSFLLGNKYECNNWNVPLDEIRPEMRVRSTQRDFRNCSHICSLTEMIAVIFGPFWNQDCTHIWTSTWLRLQSYLDLFKTEIALIIGPSLYMPEKFLDSKWIIVGMSNWMSNWIAAIHN